MPERKMNPVEEWFDILTNMRIFASKPANVDERFNPIFEACRLGGLKDKESLQYFRAMLTEEEKQEIRAGSYEYGFEEGMTKKSSEIAKNLLSSGVAMEIIVSATGLSEEEVKALA